jgi:hypothetical protein
VCRIMGLDRRCRTKQQSWGAWALRRKGQVRASESLGLDDVSLGVSGSDEEDVDCSELGE